VISELEKRDVVKIYCETRMDKKELEMPAETTRNDDRFSVQPFMLCTYLHPVYALQLL